MSAHLRSGRKGLLGLVAVAALVLAALGGRAFAGEPAGDVKSYTGCLVVGGGTLNSITEGDAPLRPCPSGTVAAHFSGGDITSVTVGPGLTGGGANGELSIGLDGTFSLP